MTDHAPKPPAGIPVRPRLTLDQIAVAAAKLISDARDAGLTEPSSLSCHGYGPPGANLYLYASDQETPVLWWDLNDGASHYGTEIAIRPAIKPGSVQASV